LPQSFDAWDYAIRGNAYVWRLGKENLSEAKRLFHAAIGLDPNSGMALCGLALVNSWEVVWGWAANPEAARLAADEFARRAIAANEHDAWAHATLAHVSLHRRRLDEAIEAAHRALALNPNMAIAEFVLGGAYACKGNYDEAVLHAERAGRLSPLDQAHTWWMVPRVLAAFVARRDEEQVELARRMTKVAPDHPSGWRWLAAGCAYLDRIDEAREAVGQLLRLVPHYTIKLARTSTPGVQLDDQERLVDGLRKAGLPE
jgi:adenylate cyclase